MPVYVNFVEPISNRCQATTISFGMKMGRLAGGPKQVAQARDVHFLKAIDSLSRQLYLSCTQGITFPSVTIEIWTTTKARTLTYTLKNALISSYQYSDPALGERTEAVSLTCESMSHRYF